MVACPICDEDIYIKYLKCSTYMFYMDHMIFLPINHIFNPQNISFNEKQNLGKPPQPLIWMKMLKIKVKGMILN